MPITLALPEIPLFERLSESIRDYKECHFAVAYLTEAAIDPLVEAIQEAVKTKGFSLSVLFSAHDLRTEPEAIRRLTRLGAKMYYSTDASFHAKAYGFRSPKKNPRVMIGSANLSAKAVGYDKESGRSVYSGELGVWLQGRAKTVEALEAVERFWSKSRPVTTPWLKTYTKAWSDYQEKSKAANTLMTKWSRTISEKKDTPGQRRATRTR